MNTIDIILIIPLLWGFYKGFTKGLVIEVASLVSLALATYGGIHFSKFVSELLKTKYNFQSEHLHLISFSIIFISVVIFVFLLAKLLSKFLNIIALGLLNKLLGAVFGTIKFALILSVMVFIVNSADEKIKFIPDETKEKSMLYNPLLYTSSLAIISAKNKL